MMASDCDTDAEPDFLIAEEPDSPVFSSQPNSSDEEDYELTPTTSRRSASIAGCRGSVSGSQRVRFFDFNEPANGEFTLDDKVLQINSLLKLTSSASIGSAESMISGTDWKLSGTICVRCETISFYNVILTMQPSTDRKNVQMTICIQRCSNRNSSGLGQIKNCDVTMRFMGGFGTAIVKQMQVEKHGFCRGLNHPYGNEITSATNWNFHPLEPMRQLCQTSERPFQNNVYHNAAEIMEFIPVEVEISFKLKVAAQPIECEQKNPSENYSFRVLSKRKSNAPMGTDTWTKKLRTDDSFADITFKVGSDLSSIFKAHKCVLAARSPVFHAMFQSDMKEKHSGEIELPDVDPSTMNSFLHLIYDTDSQSSIVFEPRVTLDVLEVAHKYQIQEVIDICTQNLVSMTSDKFDIKSSLDVFSVAHRFTIADLEFKALQSIIQNKEKLDTPEGKAAIRDFMKDQHELSPALLIGLFSN